MKNVEENQNRQRAARAGTIIDVACEVFAREKQKLHSV
jgi:hypothetical protein